MLPKIVIFCISGVIWVVCLLPVCFLVCFCVAVCFLWPWVALPFLSFAAAGGIFAARRGHFLVFGLPFCVIFVVVFAFCWLPVGCVGHCFFKENFVRDWSLVSP